MKKQISLAKPTVSYSLAFLIQQMEQARWLLTDQVDAAGVVYIVNVVPANSFRSIFLLKKPHRYYNDVGCNEKKKGEIQRVSWKLMHHLPK